ncbi:MAG: polymer-forming cytoskeletal protein [Myxococcota bacterium]
MGRTLIGPGITVEGDLEGDDELVVAGIVKGNSVTGRDVVVEKGGHLEAGVQADNVRVSGRLQGSVQAKGKVDIAGEGQLDGDVKAPRISVTDGARLKGHIDTGG